MADEGVLGNGVRVGFSADSPVSWTEVEELKDVQFPQEKFDRVDKTTHGSKYHRSFNGLLTVSDMTLVVLTQGDETDAQGIVQDRLYAYKEAGTTIWWRVEVPVDRARTKYRAYEFQGIVSDFMPGTPIADAQTTNIVVLFDGDDFTRYPTAGASAF